MVPEGSHAKILLLHDQELGDVSELLRDLGIPFVEREGDPTEDDMQTSWDLIVANQRRMGSVESNEYTAKSRRIAVVDSDSRTLRSMLRRQGVQFVVARPVHAAALRLLVLHCVYRGPERRRQSRVSVGAPVQTRTGLFRRDVILADISLHGCRLVCDKPIKAGAKMKVYIPQEIACGRAFSLPARALRSTPVTEPAPGFVVAGAFHGLTPTQGQRLRKVFENYQGGPARLVGPSSDAPQPKVVEDVPAESERRTEPRAEYDKHVVTVSDEATRVLLCRDLSIGGMRVEPNETLVPGDELLVAVHVRARSEPMVVNARVARDDGPEGLVLTFHDLSRKSEDYLRKMLDSLPSRRATSAETEGADAQEGADAPEPDMIVSQIIERRASS